PRAPRHLHSFPTRRSSDLVTCLADVPEIFDPKTNKFTNLPSARLAIPYYPFIYVLPDGRLVDAGANEDPAATTILDPTTWTWTTDRKSTRLNSSHLVISYA